MEDYCFVVIRNYRKMQQVSSNSEKDMSIIIIKESYLPPDEENKDVSDLSSLKERGNDSERIRNQRITAPTVRIRDRSQ
jgi:hypothetical protein